MNYDSKVVPLLHTAAAWRGAVTFLKLCGSYLSGFTYSGYRISTDIVSLLFIIFQANLIWKRRYWPLLLSRGWIFGDIAKGGSAGLDTALVCLSPASTQLPIFCNLPHITMGNYGLAGNFFFSFGFYIRGQNADTFSIICFISHNQVLFPINMFTCKSYNQKNSDKREKKDPGEICIEKSSR